MESITIKVPVTIKAKMTDNLREKILEGLTQNRQQAENELQQLDFEEKRVITEHAQGDLQRLQSIRQHFSIEKQNRINFMTDCEQKLADARKIANGAEILQGQIDRLVEIKVGDNMRDLMNVEILVEDDKIIAIRG